MIFFFLFLACMASVTGYAIGTIIMAAQGNPIAKAIIWFSVIFMAVFILLLLALIA
jgi:hypothetical protein